MFSFWRHTSRRMSTILHTYGQRRMSVRPLELKESEIRKKTTIASLHALRHSGIPITMLTAYDYPTAVACSSPSSNIDITLVGDSLAQVCLGYNSTTQLTLDEMIHHCRAVARGTTHPFLIADMPFGSYHVSISDAVSNAVRLIQEGRVEGVKVEGGIDVADVVQKLTSVGIPVMAHVGLLPQRHAAMSGYKVQGRDCEGATRLLKDALALEQAGAFAMVLEAIPRELGRYITEHLRVPTIGIGAGPWTSGQVLVWDDVMGTWAGHKAKFVRHFADVKTEKEMGVTNYAAAVKSGDFPLKDKESYVMDEKEWERFLKDNLDKRQHLGGSQ